MPKAHSKEFKRRTIDLVLADGGWITVGNGS